MSCSWEYANLLHGTGIFTYIYCAIYRFETNVMYPYRYSPSPIRCITGVPSLAGHIRGRAHLRRGALDQRCQGHERLRVVGLVGVGRWPSLVENLGSFGTLLMERNPANQLICPMIYRVSYMLQLLVQDFFHQQYLRNITNKNSLDDLLWHPSLHSTRLFFLKVDELGGGFMFFLHHYLGKWSNLTRIFFRAETATEAICFKELIRTRKSKSISLDILRVAFNKTSRIVAYSFEILKHTVDGRNPAPPGMQKTL